jgi:S1-C subfamily serine protease
MRVPKKPIFESMFAILLFVGGASANLATIARESTVYIYFDVEDEGTGAVSSVVGTGFVVSAQGHVITASQLFSEWQKQSYIAKEKNPIRGTLRGKPELGGEGPFRLIPVNLGHPDAPDLALLKFPDRNGRPYPTARICFREAALAEVGDEIMTYGFPFASHFQPVRGTLGTSTDRGLLGVESAFTLGMSGGPVYSARGFVIGVAKGGASNENALRFITPIQHAAPLLAVAAVVEDCTNSN